MCESRVEAKRKLHHRKIVYIQNLTSYVYLNDISLNETLQCVWNWRCFYFKIDVFVGATEEEN